MEMTDDDDTVYCDVQMPLAQVRELQQLVSTLRESKAYPRQGMPQQSTPLISSDEEESESYPG